MKTVEDKAKTVKDIYKTWKRHEKDKKSGLTEQNPKILV